MTTKISNAGPRIAKRESLVLDEAIFEDDLATLMRMALNGRSEAARVRASEYLCDCHRVAIV